jgi:RHS repeat-associated protein
MYGNRFMFTGREWDYTTQLYYYRFRDYSPQLGRFLQPDPVGYYDSMNLYAYCTNNPINWFDPWGLCSKAGSSTPPVGFPLPQGWTPDWKWEPTDDPLVGGRWRDPKGGTWRPHPDPDGSHGGDHYDHNPPGRRGNDYKDKIPTKIAIGAGGFAVGLGLGAAIDFLVEYGAFGLVLAF